MAHVNRYFEAGPAVTGQFTITDGRLDVPPGSWIAINGGTASGVWHVGDDGRVQGLRDQCFQGRVWLLEPPEDFLRLCGAIGDWCAQHPKQSLVTEQIGGYSCTRAVDEGGVPLGWQQVFSADLMPWRRMYTEVKL